MARSKDFLCVVSTHVPTQSEYFLKGPLFPSLSAKATDDKANISIPESTSVLIVFISNLQ